MYQVHRIDTYTDLHVSALVVEGIGLHVEDIFVSLVLSIILGFWPMRKTNTAIFTKF